MFEFFEILLWNIVVIFSFSINVYFWTQYIMKPEESKAFYLGLGIFSIGYGIGRLIENIRRYNIGTYHDIFEQWINSSQITGLNLALRILYYIISWTAISAMFYNFEKLLFPKTHYFITIASILEAVVSITNYLYFNLFTFYLSSVFFFIILSIPLMFFNLARKSPPGPIRNGSILLAFGIILLAIGVMVDLPEFRYFNYLANSEGFYIEPLIRVIAPIFSIIGLFIISSGFRLLLKKSAEELEVDDATKTIMGKIGIDLTRPDDLTKEDIALHREQFICLICKTSISNYFHIFLCTKCKALYCSKCAQALSSLENTCWSCDSPIDVSKTTKKLVESKSHQEKQLHKVK